MSFFKGTNTITPWINVVTDYGADPTGSTNSATAINNAIAAANSNGYNIYFPTGTYRIDSSLTALQRNGIKVRGDGRKSTIISPNFASGDVFTFGPTEGQFSSIENLSIEANVFRTSGYDINIKVSNVLVRDVSFRFSYNAIVIDSSTESILENIDINYITGTIGIYFGENFGYGFRTKNIVASNPYVTNPTVSNLKNFVGSTGYSVGDIFIVNGWIWQVTTAGTSAVSGPAAPTSTTWYTTSVANNTMQVRAICNSSLIWILQNDSDTARDLETNVLVGRGNNSMTVLGARLVGGNVGIKMQKTSGATSIWPGWLFAYGVEIEYAYTNGILLDDGYGFHGTDCWVSNTIRSNGIQANATYNGESSFNACRVTRSGENGILMNGNPDFKIDGCFVFYNGLLSSNNDASLPFRQSSPVFNDINVGTGSRGFTISDNSLGFQVSDNLVSGKANTWTAYGISIAAGCNNFAVTGNMTRGNRTGFINNISGTSTFRIETNNVNG